MNEMDRPTDSIAYVIGTYPVLTTTFIDREIEALRRFGIQPRLISIRRPAALESVLGKERGASDTLYLLPVRWQDMLSATLRWMVSRPFVLARLTAYLLTRPHSTLRDRFRTLLHIGEGILAAHYLRHANISHLHAHFADRAATVALVCARLLAVSYSVFAHANDIYVRPVLLPEKLKHASFVATCTAYNRAHLDELLADNGAPPIELVYHGLDLRRFANPAGRRPAQPPLILSVGRLCEKKGFPYLVGACRLLRERGYEFTCEIIGAGPLRAELTTFLAAQGMADIVTLRGALPHAQVLARFEKASVMALGCVLAQDDDRDGIPNVFLEAMALGVPVVGTRFSGIPELIQHDENGLLVPPGDAPALAEAIARVLDDPVLAGRLAARAHETVRRQFDIEKNIARLANLLLLAGEPARRGETTD